MALSNVPLTGQNLNVTKVPINNNFSVIDTAFLQDHVDYNASGQGKHTRVTFVDNPGATFLTGEIGLFNKTDVPTNRPDIWLTRGTAAPYPMTGYMLGGTNNGNGWSYLPSGLKMAWGRSTTGGGSSVTLTYTAELVNFPGFTTVNAFPIVSRIASGAATNFVSLTNYTQTTFQVTASAGGTGVQFAWFVIGI
jgi:hypothetical protein